MISRRLFLAALPLLPVLANTARAGEGGTVVTGPVFIRISPISFSVIGPTNRIEREVSILLNIELELGKTEDMFQPYERNMVDSFLFTLTGLYEDEPAGQSVTAEDIKSKLLAAAILITGPGLVHSVLILSVGERARR